jgi:hypothetical protein
MILIHMPNKLSTTLCMKEGLTYLMAMLAYHLPYTKLIGCDELGSSVAVRGNMRGVTRLPSTVDMLIIIMVKIIVSIVGHET